MLREIILTKAWGDHASGEIVTVDQVRAEQLVTDGFGVPAEAYVQPAPARTRARKA